MKRITLVLAIALLASPTLSYGNAASDANAGMDALSAGQYAKAVELFTRALGSGTLSAADTESAYVERGKAYLGEHADQEALADFDRALKLNPADPEVAELQAEARSTSEPDVSAASTDFPVAAALYRAGDCTGAEGAFRHILAADPYNPAANYYYADCLSRRGDIQGAINPLRLAVQYGDGVPEGQMARDAAKGLADQLSPNQGVAMGCAVPIVPPKVDGATASKADVNAAQARANTFTRASAEFQQCLRDGLAVLEAQVGHSLSGSRVENKYLFQITRNSADEVTVDQQLSDTLAAYRAKRTR
jgi:tetratricopeptide (TPR) repeat protein